MDPDPFDEWTDDDDERNFGEPEVPNADLFVDWIEQASYQHGLESDKKMWYYTLKWSGWKRNANTNDSLLAFTMTTEMPLEFWAAHGYSHEPSRPKKGEKYQDVYGPPPELMRKWMAQARSDRRERVAAEKEKALQSKGKGKGATKTTTKAKVAYVPSPPPPPRVPDSSSSSSASSSDEDQPTRRPPPAMPQPQSSNGNGYDNGKGKQKETEVRTGQSVVKKVVRKPHYSEAEHSSDEDRSRKKLKTMQTSRPKAKANTSRPSNSASTSSSTPRPNASAPNSLKTSQPQVHDLSDSDDVDSDAPVHSNTSRAPAPTEPMTPPKSQRPRPTPRINSDVKPTSTPASKATGVESKDTALSAKKRSDMFQAKEKERRRLEQEAKRQKSDSRSDTPDVGKKLKKPHNWDIADKPVSNRHGTNGTKPAKFAPLVPKRAMTDSDSDVRPRASPSMASTSQVQIPKKARTTISLTLGPNTKSRVPTISTASKTQSIGLVDLTDLTEPANVVLPSGDETLSLKDLLGEREGSRMEPEIWLEQTFTSWQAAVVLRSVVEREGGGVVQFCRVEAAVKGDVDDRSEREMKFRKMAWWLEEGHVGGSIAVSYLAQSPYALVVIPRSSNICVELDVPSSLRDSCRPYKESLIGVLVILPRPSLPMPSKASIEISQDKNVLGFHLESYPIDLESINSLRARTLSDGVAIYAPQTTEALPGVALLQELLTAPPEGPVHHPPARLVPVPSLEADEETIANFAPRVVLCHNAMSLWALPNLVALRRRSETEFWSFGAGKDTYVQEQKTSRRQFGLASAVQITLTPALLLDEPAAVKRELIPLLKAGASDYKLVLHPSTIAYVDAECANDRAPQANVTLSALMSGCRSISARDAPFAVAGTQPLNQIVNAELLDRNVDLDDDIETAKTYPDIVKICQTYCEKDGSIDPTFGDEITLERAESDALGMMRSNLRHPTLVNKFRRFVVVGPTKSDSDDVEDLRTGAENMTLEELLAELKAKF